MANHAAASNRVRQRRIDSGLTQAELAVRAGISRTAVTAIEGGRLTPSVTAALSLAAALGTSVEELFGVAKGGRSEVWAWMPREASEACWAAEVRGQLVRYPWGSAPMLTPLPDIEGQSSSPPDESHGNDTLVLASCDPAAGLLASLFAAVTGMRLLVVPRSSRQSLDLVRDGLVHMAGMHLSTREDPDANARAVRSTLGGGHQLLRVAWWEEGIVITPTAHIHSVRAAVHSHLSWVGREEGSGARKCLDRLLEGRKTPQRIARNHRSVVEAVQSGWADAGVCVRLVGAEAGLDFLPVQREAYDVCFPTPLLDDRRFKAFLGVVRSSNYRRILKNLSGYGADETGNVWEIK
jgi:molybdate-binding protein